MGVAMRQFTPCQQPVGGLQGIGDLVIDLIDVFAGEHRHVIVETTVLADGLGDLNVVGLAQNPVIGAVPRRNMDDASAFLGGGEVGGECRDVEVIALAIEGVAADSAVQFLALEGGACGHFLDPALADEIFQASFGDDQFFPCIR